MISNPPSRKMMYNRILPVQSCFCLFLCLNEKSDSRCDIAIITGSGSNSKCVPAPITCMPSVLPAVVCQMGKR